MSLFSLLAPTATDREYCQRLIGELAEHNVNETCIRVKELLKTTDSVTRKDVLPVLAKISELLDGKHVQSAASVMSLFVEGQRILFRESDLRELMIRVIDDQELLGSSFTTEFLGVCAKSVTSGRELIGEVMEYIPLASLPIDENVTSFLMRISHFVPELRVPFVFAGLIEQIMPTIGVNDVHMALLTSLIADPQSRQYFAGMGHVPTLASVMLESKVSVTAVSAFRVLLDAHDLLHLNSLQRILFECDVPSALVQLMIEPDATDMVVGNAAVCLGDCIRYFRLMELPFSTDALYDLVVARPAVHSEIMYVFENLAVSSAPLFPRDDAFLEKPVWSSDPCVVLYLSYLSYDCHHSSSLEIRTFSSVIGHAMSLLLAIGVQRRVVIDGSELAAQTPEHVVRRQLASANCLVTGAGVIPRAALVHYASLFFAQNARSANKCFGGHTGDFFPQSFLAWGVDTFSVVNRGRLVHARGSWAISGPALEVDISPDESRASLISLNGRATGAIRDNDLWRARYEALETRHQDLALEYQALERELIDSRCQQMTRRAEKTE